MLLICKYTKKYLPLPAKTKHWIMQQYDVFISYARKDYVDESNHINPRSIICTIQHALNEAGLTYWIDKEGLKPGESFSEKIANQIENCKVFLLVSSSHSNQSKWVVNEVATAHHFNKPIIPFRSDNSEYNKGLLFYIAGLQYIDTQSGISAAMDGLVAAIKEQIHLVEAGGLNSPEHPDKKPKRNYATYILIAALVLLLGVLISAWIVKSPPLPPPAPKKFIKGVHKCEVYKPAKDRRKVGTTYRYEGRNIKVQFYFYEEGMCAVLVDKHGNRLNMEYPDPFGVEGEAEFLYADMYENHEYAITQYDFDADGIDEIVIAARIKGEDQVPVRVFVYRFKDRRWWSVTAPETWGDMTVKLSVNHIRVEPNNKDFIYDWAFENGDFVDYGEY